MSVLLRATFSVLVLAAPLAAQPVEAPPADEAPLLRINASGPLGVVEALRFSADGRTLYAGGWDQVIHAWSLDANGRFAYDPEKVLRVPAGVDLGGAISSLGLSDDGRWLAAAGRGFVSEGNKRTGWVWPASSLDERAKLDRGTIYVFDLRGERPPRMLRGHRDQVVRVAFAATGRGPTTLVSFGEDATLRVWDVESGREVAALANVPRWDERAREWKWKELPHRNPLEPFASRIKKPDLVAWRTGPEPHDVKVAFLAMDVFAADPTGKEARIYVWQPRPKVVDVEHAAAPHHSLRMIAGPDGNGSLLFSTIQDVRQIAAGRVDEAARARPRRIGDSDEHEELFDLALVEKDGLASLILRQREDDFQFSVRLHGLRGDLQARSAEWEDDAPQPMAASPAGDRIAVVDGRAGAVRLYEVARLRGGDRDPVQMLRTNGREFRRVTFARAKADQRLGLLLGRDPDGEKWDHVVDVRERKVSDDVDGWTAEPSETVDGKIDWDPDRWGVRIRGDGGTVRIPFTRDIAPDGHQAYATCPAGEHCRVPLIALNLVEDGSEPIFLLCDVEQGRQLRWYTGHTGPILDFAFSADGRFLASVGADRTVRVWPVEDVDETTLEKRGEVHGLELVERVENGREQLVVRETPDPRQLKAGTVVQGVVENDAEGKPMLAAHDRVWDLYHHVTRIAPGGTVTLRTNDGEATLPVGQATDVRWPLFSLFVDEEGDELSWVAWDPVGKYDFDAPRMQDRIGWHFNTGDPDQPVLFATGDQYREQNHERKMMWHRLEGAEPPPPPPPKFSLRFFSRGYEDHPLEVDRRHGVVSVARGTDVYGLVSVEESGLERVEAVELGIPVGEEGVRWVPMKPHEYAGHAWVADVAWPGESGWERRRAPYAFRARVRVRGRREWFEESHPVVYAPYAPQLDSKDEPSVDPEGNVAFRVWVASPSGEFDLEVKHLVDGKPQPLENPEAVEQAIRDGKPVRIPAGPGVNRVSVGAWNRGSDAFPWSRLERTVLHLPSLRHDDGPPPVAVDAVGGGHGDGPIAKNVYRVTSSTTRVHGTVAREATVPVLEFVDAAGREPVELQVDPQTRRFTVPVADLKPGDNRLAVGATRNGVASTQPFTVRYVPVPTCVLREPGGRSRFTRADGPRLTVLAAVEEPDGSEATSLVVTQAGKPVPAEAVRRVGDSFEVDVTLQPGTNVIGARVAAVTYPGADGPQPLGEDEGQSENVLSLVYLQPPELHRETLDYAKRTEQSAIDVAFEVTSFETPRIELRRNRRPVEPQDLLVEEKQPERWRVVLKGVPLKTDREFERWSTSDVAILVENGDGADAADLDPIRYVGPPAEEDVELSFGAGVTDGAKHLTCDSFVELPIHVKTNVRLERVEVVSGEEAVVLGALPDPIAARFNGAKTIRLSPDVGEHRLSIRARSGEDEPFDFAGDETVRLNVLDPPARVVVEDVLARSPEGEEQILHNESTETIRLRDAANGEIAKYGEVVVRGRIANFGRLCARTKAGLAITGSVNGFRYDERRVDPETGEFALTLLLNSESNSVRLSSPNAPLTGDGTENFELACADPMRNQHLHLVAISTKSDDAELVQTVGDALDLVRADDEAGSTGNDLLEDWTCKSGVFETVHWRAVYTRERACRRLVEPFLQYLADDLAGIHTRERDRRRTDVVLLYYEGDDAVVREEQGGRDFALACRDGALVTGDYLRGTLGTVRGVQLIFMDTTHLGDGPVEKVVRNADTTDKRRSFGVIRVTAAEENRHVLRGVEGAIRSRRGRVGDVLEVIEDDSASPPAVDSFVDQVGDVLLGASEGG